MKHFIQLTDYEGDPVLIDLDTIALMEVRADGPHRNEHDGYDPDCMCQQCRPDIGQKERSWWSRTDILLSIRCDAGQDHELLAKCVRETVDEIAALLARNEEARQVVVRAWRA